MNYFRITLLLLSTIYSNAHAQKIPSNKYGLQVVNKLSLYKKTAGSNESKRMEDISYRVPGIVIDLKYSSDKNFTGTPLYPQMIAAYARKAVTERIAVVQKQLNKKDLGLKIWDAYRPYSVTEKMWELVKDDRYAADPRKGSGHNRGVAIDLTIISLADNKELNMGSDFDNFTDTAHHNFDSIPAEVKANRKLLRELMEAAGFIALETEWWHYFLPDHKNYELLDLSFKEMKKAVGFK